MIRNLLVPLDGSPFCEHALPYAVSLARQFGARITLVHVQVPMTSFISADGHLPLTPYDDSEVEQSLQSYLQATAEKLRAITGGTVTTVFREGKVADVICEVTAAEAIDLVVLTTHGRGPLSRLWLGCVANELSHLSTAPLLLIRPSDATPDLQKPVALRRFLIPVDGSSFAECVIPLALSFNVPFQTQYRLISVIPPLPTSPGGKDYSLLTSNPALAERVRADTEAYLAKLKASKPALQKAETHIAVDTAAAGAILADAETSRADLIAMTTHGRSGVARLLLGSVADKVVRGATIPVLLVRPGNAQ